MKIALFLTILCFCCCATTLAQEQTTEFVGEWMHEDYGLFYMCQSGNDIYGAYALGFFEGILSPDRRTVSGFIYEAGNTGENDEGEFRISITENGGNVGFLGWIFTDNGPTMWTATRQRQFSPSPETQCWSRATVGDRTIEGRYVSAQGGAPLEICTSDDGFGWEATWGDIYMRGPSIASNQAGRGQWWSSTSYGSVIFSLVNEKRLLFTSFEKDKEVVYEFGCDEASCNTVEFADFGSSSPAACTAKAGNGKWDGYFTFTPDNGVLAMRRQGQYVVGSWRYGIIEGIVSEDGNVLDGTWWNAAWDPNASIRKARYFGTFTVHLSGDGNSFDGTWSLNGDFCLLSDDCTVEWSEDRLLGVHHTVTPYDANQITTRRNPDDDFNVDGTYVPNFNINVRLHLCRQREQDYDPDRSEDDPNYIVLDSDERQRTKFTWTHHGTGYGWGVIRTQTELGTFQSSEPANSTHSLIWTDDFGVGNAIDRKWKPNQLHEYWFANAAPTTPPDLAYCDWVTESNCGEIFWNYEDPATWKQCTYGERLLGAAASLSSSSALFMSAIFAAIIMALLQQW